MLRDVILAWLARDPLSSPLDDEVFLVQSQGMAQWLKHALAESPAGIAAAHEDQSGRPDCQPADLSKE